MIKKVLFSLAIIALQIPLQARAACTNLNYPQYFQYTYFYPNGSRLLQIHMWDNDNVDHRALLLYNQNNEVIASSIGGSNAGYISIIQPRGAGSWYFAGGDVNSCGTLVRYLRGPQFLN